MFRFKFQKTQKYSICKEATTRFEVERVTAEEQEPYYALQDRSIQGHLLMECPTAKLQEAMHRDMQMVADFDVAEVVPFFSTDR